MIPFGHLLRAVAQISLVDDTDPKAALTIAAAAFQPVLEIIQQRARGYAMVPLTARKLLQEKAIAIENDIRGLRNLHLEGYRGADTGTA
jgi:hypothetical protein